MICWKCSNSFELDSLNRNSVCPSCGADLHSCKQCKFFSPGSHYDCKETIDELVKDKERSNFCDFFMVRKDKSENQDNKIEKARNAAAALFGESAEVKDNSPDAAKDAFNALFK